MDRSHATNVRKSSADCHKHLFSAAEPNPKNHIARITPRSEENNSKGGLDADNSTRNAGIVLRQSTKKRTGVANVACALAWESALPPRLQPRTLAVLTSQTKKRGL